MLDIDDNNCFERDIYCFHKKEKIYGKYTLKIEKDQSRIKK